MTYSSRNFLISCGVGSEDRVPRFSKRLSSAMMSLQTSTHSSQMKTVGPAISLRTSFWSLLQKEHRRTSVSPPFFTILFSASRGTPESRRAGPKDLRDKYLSILYLSSYSTYTPACPRPLTRACLPGPAYLCSLPDDIVNNTVFLTLVRRHDVVALCVVLDTLDGL